MSAVDRRRFTADGLKRAGFVGFQTVKELRRNKLDEVPCRPGVYVVLRTDIGDLRFRRKSVGGWFRCMDPSVPVGVLRANWVDGAQAVYIGRASGGRDPLQARIGELMAFGMGLPVAHRGGRYIWQLSRSEELVVCWKVDEDPHAAELDMQKRFFAAYQALPFANIKFGSAREIRER